MTKYQNPYVSEETVRFTLDLGKADYTQLKVTRPTQGTVTTTISILISKLCDELRKRNLDDASVSDQFEECVLGIHLVPDDEYSSLMLDATKWQEHLAAGGERGRPLGSGLAGHGTGGLSHGAPSGPVQPTSPPNDCAGADKPHSGNPPTSTVVPNVQGGGRSRRKRA